MKRLLSAFLLCALLLSLAGCGAKKDALTAPPELTVTNAQDASVAVSSGSYDWNYALGNGERSGAIGLRRTPAGRKLPGHHAGAGNAHCRLSVPFLRCDA